MDIKEKKEQIPFITKTINVEGIDQTGIVYKVSRFLADNNINIENLVSQRITSPESGTAIYTMEIKVQVPEKFSLEQLEKGLSQVGEQLNLDITIG